jgi:hypothetical protein
MKRPFTVFLAFSAAIASSAFLPESNTGEGPEMERQRTPVHVSIVESADSVGASPASVTVTRGQRVEWSSDLGDWEVLFSSDEPFGPGENRRIFGRQGQAKGNAIQSSARFGTYKYDIQVTLPDGTVLTADPEIVVEPGEGEK